MQSLFFLLLGALIVAALGAYAGHLLFQLQQQKNEFAQRRLLKEASLTDSIRTIAIAVKQEQCQLSEAAIRIVKLLEAMPFSSLDYTKEFPKIHQLVEKIKHMPSHERRQQQTRRERNQMDVERLSYETQLKSQIVPEIERLVNFSVSGNEV